MAEKNYLSDIIERIEATASSYVPEWKFDFSNPDAGSALAIIFANQLADSLERFKKMPSKHQLAFYSLMGGNINPASPAQGIVCIDGTELVGLGQTLGQGFKLYADTSQERLAYKTLSDVFVSSSTLTEMIFTDYQTDSLCFCQDISQPFKNIKTKPERWIELRHPYLNLGVDTFLNIDNLNTVFAQKNIASPFYITDQNERLNTSCELTERGIYFKGQCSSGIGFNIHNPQPFEHNELSTITISSQIDHQAPTAITVNGQVQANEQIYPFNKAFTLLDEVAFFSPVLGIPNASISLSFNISIETFTEGEEFAQAPLPPKKLIILKKNLPKPKIYNAFINSVEWEYFNGKGFVPLKLNKNAEDIFNGKHQGTTSIDFTQPNDIEPLIIGSVEGYCIRARIRQADNAWSRPAKFHSPLINNIHFSCTSLPCPITDITAYTNGGITKKGHPIDFSKPTPNAQTLYLGFNKTLSGGQISLFIMASGGRGATYQYLSKNGWKTLNVTDNTNGLSTYGTLTFTINEPTHPSYVFGKQAHWLRAILAPKSKPIIERIYTNAVAIMQYESVQNQTYYVDKSGICPLNHKNVFDETIYLNEQQNNPLICERDYRINRADGIIEFSDSIKRQDGFSIQINFNHGGGKHTNLDSFTQLSPAFFAGNLKFTNPLPLLGGSQPENLNQACARMAKRLKSRSRCVSLGSYIDTISNPQIAHIEPLVGGGTLTLLTLINDYKNSYIFSCIRQEALKNLANKLPIGYGKVDIIPPTFNPTSLKMHLTVQEHFNQDSLKNQIMAQFNPIAHIKNGNLGLPINYRHLYSLIASHENVAQINSLQILTNADPTPTTLPQIEQIEITLTQSR